MIWEKGSHIQSRGDSSPCSTIHLPTTLKEDSSSCCKSPSLPTFLSRSSSPLKELYFNVCKAEGKKLVGGDIDNKPEWGDVRWWRRMHMETVTCYNTIAVVYTSVSQGRKHNSLSIRTLHQHCGCIQLRADRRLIVSS